jgi:dihydroorotate dehydrogenase (fumarate)
LTDLYPETLDFYDDFDTGHISTENYLKLISDAKKSLNIPVIASINCVSSEEWTYFPRVIQRTGADALELNLFILPTDLSRSADENEKIYFEIIENVKKQISIPDCRKNKPLLFKFSSNIKENFGNRYSKCGFI